MAFSFTEYARAAKKTAHYPQDVGLAYLVLGLNGEAGELSNKYKKVLRDEDGILSAEKILEMRAECGDVLWYLDRLCHELGTSLDKVAKDNIVKLASREKRGVISGSGDNR